MVSGQWANLGFLMTTESQDLGFNGSSKVFFTVQCPHHYTGVLGPTQTTGWAPPTGLTSTSSSSNLVFPGGLPSRYWPGSTLLSFSGQPVLGYRVIWLLAIFQKKHVFFQFLTPYINAVVVCSVDLKGVIGCPFSTSWYNSLGSWWKVYNILWLKVS